MTRTFEIGFHIWFVLHHDDHGVLVGLEEHDHYAGGHTTKPDHFSWGEEFVQRAVERISSSDPKMREYVRKEATKFLSSGRKSVKIK